MINLVPPTSNTTRSDAPKERLCRLAGGGWPSLLLLSLLEDMVISKQNFNIKTLKRYENLCKGLYRLPYVSYTLDRHTHYYDNI